MTKKLKPFTSKQAHEKRIRAAVLRGEEHRQARRLKKLLKSGGYVDVMGEGCKGWK